MSTLFVTEYARFVKDSGGGFAMNVGQEPALAEQQVSISGGSTASSAFSSATRLIRVQSDVNCRIAIGASPTASAASKRLVANATEYFGVRGGDAIAVITGS